DALLGEDQPRAMTPREGRPRKERHDRSTVGDYRHPRSILGASPQNEASRSRKYAVERPQEAIIARTGSLRTDEAIGALSGDVLPDFLLQHPRDKQKNEQEADHFDAERAPLELHRLADVVEEIRDVPRNLVVFGLRQQP